MPLLLKKLLLPAILLALLAGLVISLSSKDSAPNLTMTSISGEKLSLQQLRGKMVLINFWATSCPGCIEEMPKLVDTYQRYHGKGLEIIAVAMSYDPPNHVLNYSKQHALPFPVVLDTTEDASHAFGNVQVTPTTFVIDKQGKVVRHILGTINFADLETLLSTTL